MTNPITIRVFDVVAGRLCVSAEDGQYVHDKIAPLLREGRPVALSFARVETTIAAFLSAAVGQLYGEFSDARVCGLLRIHDLPDSDRALLARVVRNAKMYYANRAAFDAAWDEELGDGNEGRQIQPCSTCAGGEQAC